MGVWGEGKIWGAPFLVFSWWVFADPRAGVLRKDWGQVSQCLGGDGFYFRAVWAQVPVLRSKTLSARCSPCIPRVDFLSFILIFYHLGSICYRWFSGGRFQLLASIRPAVVRQTLSVTPGDGVWHKFSGENSQAFDASTDFVSAEGGSCCTSPPSGGLGRNHAHALVAAV